MPALGSSSAGPFCCFGREEAEVIPPFGFSGKGEAPAMVLTEGEGNGDAGLKEGLGLGEALDGGLEDGLDDGQTQSLSLGQVGLTQIDCNWQVMLAGQSLLVVQADLPALLQKPKLWQLSPLGQLLLLAQLLPQLGAGTVKISWQGSPDGWLIKISGVFSVDF